jgi:Kef-type K+ transport system membrane component KefB
MLLFFGAGIWFVLVYGARKHSSPPSAPTQISDMRAGTTDSSSVAASFAKVLRGNLRNPLSILLLQLAVIIIAARFFGMLFLKIDQPRVMGEIVAGIVLGPSVLGLLAPRTMEFLFPVSSMETLRLLSQVGVTLFMFIVGMDLSVAHLRKKAHTAIMVSHASIIVPFLMGAALSLVLYQTLATGGTSFTAFALFMGIAMSITAFPVLARILEDRRMSQSKLGSMAITCAAVDDVTAWCLLAVVIAIAQAGEVIGSVITIGLTLVFICLMLFAIKPLLARLIKEQKEYGRGIFAAVLAFVFGCALITETIGIHALFGAFLAGVVLPGSEGFRTQFKEKLQTVSSVVLLPLFFAFSGLRMQIGLLGDWYSWLLCAVIILVAITGKLGGSMLMARLVGMKWRESFTLGVLLNTRGLIELIVLNIGYDLGILSAQTFAMMVLMALVTTFMTGPLLSLVRFGRSERAGAAANP